ncbi:MAG: hypothetical protein P0Y55_06445 [Candidatus Cohnella colombiensis]|uniref:Uncharacterized protein n=1 Tax=Candidatus Cohnella colombiensis TaxID=3121368 RepID=A0AA95EY64_9BACL|nr:MAG: hypothetical protein P0Y55_06445 [Cohnella sp.]
MQNTYPEFALRRLAELLAGSEAQWVVGGSTGLVLRGAKLEQAPRDLDVYADQNVINDIHERLKHDAVDGPEWSVTDRYRSILSHYRIEDTVVELVGDFNVNAHDSSYDTRVEQWLFPNRDSANVHGYSIPLIPLAHELIFNLLRDRMDRAQVVGELMKQQPDRHLPLLYELLDRNEIAPSVAEIALQLTGTNNEQAAIHRESSI